MQYSIIGCFLVAFLLSWGALSTYWKKKGVDPVGWNWFLHGLFIGLAFLPFVFIGFLWQAILLRAAVLGILMMIWSVLINSACWEEFGRGVLIILTIPLII